MLFISIFVLDLYNFKISMMKKNRKVLWITAFLTMGVVLGFIVIKNETEMFQGLYLLIIALIIIGGVIAFITAYKREKEEKEGLATDDELSNRIKYKAGYYAYLASLYMWLFIFLFKDKFPDVETMLGGGILLSALMSFIAKYIVKQKFNE